MSRRLALVAVIALFALLATSQAAAATSPAELCAVSLTLPEPGKHLPPGCRPLGRSIDQVTNPGFWQTGARELPGTWPGVGELLTGPSRSLSHHAPGAYVGDPYRLPWNWEQAGRGLRIPTDFENRFGARLTANLWFPPHAQPVPHTKTRSRLPAVVIVPGARGFQDTLRWAAQGLAESGYLAMTVDPQDTGRSESCGRPTETDECPGAPTARDYTSAGSATHVAAVEDSIDWLLNDSPYASYVDSERLAVAGHSLGAFAALIVGNRDPRIDAVVAWDSNAALPPTFVPRVPTMLQNSETAELCPVATGCTTLAPAAPGGENPGSAGRDDHVAVRNARAFIDAGVPVHQTVLAGSTHNEWAYQIAPPGLSASSAGERVAMHYTLAWVDLWLSGYGRGEPSTAASHPRNLAAAGRLVARTFDTSADASAIGTGWWDALAARNVPYTIAGDPVASHLSELYRSQAHLGSSECPDLRLGC